MGWSRGSENELKNNSADATKQTSNKQRDATRINVQMFVSCDKRHHLHNKCGPTNISTMLAGPNHNDNLEAIVMANHSIYHFDHHPKRATTVCRMSLAQHLAGATMTEAMRKARGGVKEALKRQAVRLCEVEARDITSWAQVYLDDHPELIAEAKLVIQGYFLRGVFGKRAQKEFIKQLMIEQTQVEGSVANGQS
jgi:hypothetical protein